jgi:hypothetical protein
VDYLIPANSKKSLLLFGLFNWFDLILFASGVGITLILLLVISPASFVWAIVDIAPALVCGLLVFPIPNYHNTLTVIKNLYVFYSSRQKFIWKGWCVKDGFKEQK